MQSVLMQNTLLPLLYRNRIEELEGHHPCVLTLLSYSMVGIQEGMQCLREIRQARVRVRMVVDEMLLEQHSITTLAKETLIDDIMMAKEWKQKDTTYSYLFIPVLPASLVTKILDFDDGHLFSRFILEALYQGKKVGAIAVGADPYQQAWRQQGYDRMPPLLKTEMKSRLQKLRGYGVELLQTGQVGEWLRQADRKGRRAPVIAREEVEEAHRKHHDVIHTSPYAIITPLANELAQQYGIQILKR